MIAATLDRARRNIVLQAVALSFVFTLVALVTAVHSEPVPAQANELAVLRGLLALQHPDIVRPVPAAATVSAAPVDTHRDAVFVSAQIEREPDRMLSR